MRFRLNFEPVFSAQLGALANGTMSFYSSGTEDLVPIWQDQNMNIPRTNPVVLDSSGRHGDIFLNDMLSYRVIVRDANGAVMPGGDVDPVSTLVKQGGGGGDGNTTIDPGDIPDGSITTVKLANGSVTTVKLGDASVVTQKIGDNQIVTAKIGDSQVTTQKIGDDQVTSAKMEMIGGSVMDELFVRGTGMNTPANNLVVVGGRIDVNAAARGLTLTVLERSTHLNLPYYKDPNGSYLMGSNHLYDLGGPSGDSEAYGLRNALQEWRTNSFGTHSGGSWGGNVIVILTSYDGWSLTPPNPATAGPSLGAEMLLAGASSAILQVGSIQSLNAGSIQGVRVPYLLIGIPGIGEGRGIEIIITDTPGAPFASYDGIMVDGNLPGLGGLAEGSISTALLRAGSVVADKIGAEAVVAGKIAAGAVVAGTIAAGAVAAGTLAAGAVTVGTIAAGAVTAGTIAAGAVTATAIAVGAINGAMIQDGAITASKIAAGSVNGTTIQDGTITTTELAANAVTAGQISANAVNASNILVSDIVVTGHLVAQAATIFAATSAPDLHGIAADSNYHDFCSVTFTSEGAPVFVSASCLLRTPNSDSTTHFVYIRLIRFGTLLGNARIWPASSDDDGVFRLQQSQPFCVNVSLAETPGPGSATYTLQYKVADSSNINILAPFIQCVEIKK